MRLRTLLVAVLTVSASAFLAVPAASADVIFNLSNVDLQYGGTLTGSFTTNNALTSVTAYDIVASAGPGSPGFTFSGNTYTGADSNITVNLVNKVFQADENIGGENFELRLVFASALSATNAVTLTSGSSYESEHYSGNRSVTSGSVTPAIASTPEPSSLLLLGTGILGLGGMLRRRLI